MGVGEQGAEGAGYIRVFAQKAGSLNVSVQFSSVAQLCPTLCDPMDCSTPGFPVPHRFPGLAQTHVH